MSTLEGCERYGLSEFSGARPLLDVIDLAPDQAQSAQNCRFAPGKVQTRAGFKTYFATGDDSVVCPYYYSENLTGTPQQYLAHIRKKNSTGIETVSLFKTAGSGYLNILTLAGTVAPFPPKAIFASFGARLYAAITQFDAAIAPTRSPWVWDGNSSNQMISCFQRPMKTTEVTEALTQPGAGVITAGTHYVGVLFQTKAGYWTKPGPADATTLALTPQSIASTGTNNIRVTLTPATTWPTWIQAVQVIMTTAENSFDYFLVPGTITSVTSGSATVYAIDLNITDLQLTSVGSQGAGTSATDYFSLLSMNASNVQPVQVNAVIAWGQRMVWVGSYGGTDCLFPSDPLNPEWITADQHILQLPSGKPIGSVFVLRGVLYAISSAGGLYAWVDNGGRPVTFSPPATVDERVSALGYFSTSVAASGGYALIASQQGLYAFSGGALAVKPISYYQSPAYDRISWSLQANTLEEGVQVIDYPTERLIVLKGYMSDTAQTEMLVWDYSLGMNPQEVNFSRWVSTAFTTNYPSMGLAKISNLFQLLDGEAGEFLRLQSAQAGDSGSDLYSEIFGASSTIGINWQYQTAPLPKLDDSPMLQHLAVRFRAKSLTGTPSIYFSAKSLDNVRAITLPLSPVALSTAPGKEYIAFYDSQEERASYLFTNNAAVGAGIVLARLTHFYNFFAEQR